MRNTLFFIGFLLFVTSCKKDKFTTAPQITFKSFKPDIFDKSNTNLGSAIMTLQLTDSEGDIGFNDGSDSSYVYITNISVTPVQIDSLPFPLLGNIKRKDLNAEIAVDLSQSHNILDLPAAAVLPHTDTLIFEVYVKDFAKNKSNVITTPPFYLYQQ